MGGSTPIVRRVVGSDGECDESGQQPAGHSTASVRRLVAGLECRSGARMDVLDSRVGQRARHRQTAAEEYAAEVMRALGFFDAQVTGSGADGGVDVRAKDAVAQVKMEGSQRPGRSCRRSLELPHTSTAVQFCFLSPATQPRHWGGRTRQQSLASSSSSTDPWWVELSAAQTAFSTRRHSGGEAGDCCGSVG